MCIVLLSFYYLTVHIHTDVQFELQRSMTGPGNEATANVNLQVDVNVAIPGGGSLMDQTVISISVLPTSTASCKYRYP